MANREGWWLAGRTVPGAVAGNCQILCFFGFVASSALTSDKPSPGLPAVLAVVALVIALVIGVASVRGLRRHPSWVREPVDPLSAADARLWWSYGLVSLGLLIVMSVAQFWLRSGTVLAIQFFPFLLGMWSFSVLSRRAGSTGAPAVNLAGRHQDG